MSAMELKGTIFDLLWKETDQEVLSKIKEFAVETILQKKEKEVDGWSDLPLEQRMKMEKALEDIKHGRNIKTHEEVMKGIKERMKSYPV